MPSDRDADVDLESPLPPGLHRSRNRHSNRNKGKSGPLGHPPCAENVGSLSKGFAFESVRRFCTAYALRWHWRTGRSWATSVFISRRCCAVCAWRSAPVAMKCCGCSNPAFDNHPRAPLCLPCLDAWREFEGSPRITQKPVIDSTYKSIDAIFAELTRQLEQSQPTLARTISSVLAGGIAGLDALRYALTPDEAVYGLPVLISLGSPGGGVGMTLRRKCGPRHESRCSVCLHPLRAEIDEAFVNWMGPRRIARKYHISPSLATKQISPPMLVELTYIIGSGLESTIVGVVENSRSRNGLMLSYVALCAVWFRAAEFDEIRPDAWLGSKNRA